MEKVVRKTMLYKTGVEYGDYTINHVVGCSHACKYPCYAYMMSHRFGKAKDLEDWSKVAICDNTLDILKREVPKLKNKIKTVYLSFATDPFMYENKEVCKLSLEIIKLLNDNDIYCTILTKGVLPNELVSFSKENVYGITLISLDDDFRKEYEPGAASIESRLNSLKFLKENGCKTWVSMEPYPTPNIKEQNLIEILNAIKFVDKIIFGRLNYNKKVSQYKNYKSFFNECAKTVIEFCTNNNIEFHIKEGTITE